MLATLYLTSFPELEDGGRVVISILVLEVVNHSPEQTAAARQAAAAPDYPHTRTRLAQSNSYKLLLVESAY